MTAPHDTADSPALAAPRRRRWQMPDVATDVLAFTGAMACAVVAAVLAAVLSGCGGGVETGGTGSFASGPITGYGSIVVGGIHFDETQASVQDDDAKELDRSALALGMVVQVTGGNVGLDASGRSVATATQVRAVRALLGQVVARNAGAGTLTVLDQSVVAQADTVIDAALGGAVSGIALGAVVEVYGSFDTAAGVWRATRIAPAPAAQAASFSLRGTVSAVDTVAKTVVVNGRTYSTATLTNAGSVKVGDDLKLNLDSSTDDQGRWVAKGSTGSGPTVPQDRDSVQASGLISKIVGARWTVDGTTVDVSAATVTGTPVVGAQAAVSGVLRSGVLVAATVKVSTSGGGGSGQSFEVEGTLTALDTVRKRFTVRAGGTHDTVVSYARSDIAYKNGASAAALVGYTGKLKVKGALSADRSVLEATEIEFDD